MRRPRRNGHEPCRCVYSQFRVAGLIVIQRPAVSGHTCKFHKIRRIVDIELYLFQRRTGFDVEHHVKDHLAALSAGRLGVKFDIAYTNRHARPYRLVASAVTFEPVDVLYEELRLVIRNVVYLVRRQLDVPVAAKRSALVIPELRNDIEHAVFVWLQGQIRIVYEIDVYAPVLYAQVRRIQVVHVVEIKLNASVAAVFAFPVVYIYAGQLLDLLARKRSAIKRKTDILLRVSAPAGFGEYRIYSVDAIRLGRGIV